MKFSIVTVTYNSATTLRSTIQSVLSQTYSDIEYIIIDGASTDDTISIINEYEPKFNGRLKWISEKDTGLYDAMNKGILMATGEVIGILNSDDFFTSNNVLESVSKAFNTEEADAIYGVDAIYGDVCFVSPKNIKKPIRYYSSKIFKRSLMKLGFMPAHPTFYCRRACFDKYGIYSTDYKICADFDLLLRFIYINSIKIKYISLNMVTMRLGGVSTRGLKSHLCIMKEHILILRENGIKTNAAMLSLRYLYKLTELIRKL